MDYSNNVYSIEEIIQCIKKLLKQNTDIKEVVLFGSYSRDEATPISDIDILVTNPSDIKPMKMWAFGGDIKDSLKKPVDIFRMKSVDKSSDFYHNVEKDGVVIHAD